MTDTDVTKTVASAGEQSVTIAALRPPTKSLLSMMLNPLKLILSENGVPRDWRGLAYLTGLEAEQLPAFAVSNDPVAKVLFAWRQHDKEGCTITVLQNIFMEMDRFDVYDDTLSLIEQDVQAYQSKETKPSETQRMQDALECDKNILTVDDVARMSQGLEAQNYDAFVLFADEDINFATELIETMEKQYGFKLCVKERDLVGGLAFEHEAIIRLISERCHRLLVIVSPAFLKSPANKFFVHFAQALGIEQRQRKIIPCLYEPCKIPHELSYYFMLDYKRTGKLWNFWDKLRDSINTPDVPSKPVPRIVVEEARISLPDLKPALLRSKNSLSVKKDGVRFSSMVNIGTEDEQLNGLNIESTSSNSLNIDSPSQTETSKSKTGWFKKLIKHKDGSVVDSNGVVDGSGKKKFWSKTRRKLAILN